jgi:uncharacterized protein (DUF342 family)
MKILTKNKQDELLIRIVANEIIASTSIDKVEELKQHVENAFEMAEIIGGIKGAKKVQRTVERCMEMRRLTIKEG